MKGHCPLFGTGSTQSYLNSGLKTVGVLSHCLAHNRVPKPLGYTQAVGSAGAGALPGGVPGSPRTGLAPGDAHDAALFKIICPKRICH